MSRGKVLVVEDSELIRTIYGDNLSVAGYEVARAADGLEGLEKVHSFKPDLILLDLVMPRLTGLQLLEKLKDDPVTSDIPVVILTESQNEDRLKESLKLGVEDFIRKSSISPNEVSKKVEEILGKQRTRENGAEAAKQSFKVVVRDREADADELVEHLKAPARFWCQRCQEELILTLTPSNGHRDGHWFEAHFVCGKCGQPV